MNSLVDDIAEVARVAHIDYVMKEKRPDFGVQGLNEWLNKQVGLGNRFVVAAGNSEKIAHVAVLTTIADHYRVRDLLSDIESVYVLSNRYHHEFPGVTFYTVRRITQMTHQT